MRHAMNSEPDINPADRTAVERYHANLESRKKARAVLEALTFHEVACQFGALHLTKDALIEIVIMFSTPKQLRDLIGGDDAH